MAVRCRALFHIITPRPRPDVVAIIDVGHDIPVMTVTNDIDAVVLKLIELGVLRDGDKLIYRDSTEVWDEVIWDKDGFRRFNNISRGSMEAAAKKVCERNDFPAS